MTTAMTTAMTTTPMTPISSNGQEAGQPATGSGVTYIALRDFKYNQLLRDGTGGQVLDEDGHPVTLTVNVKAGERVPDAANWPTLESLIRTGFLERQRDTDSLELRLADLERRVQQLEARRSPRRKTASSSRKKTAARKITRKTTARRATARKKTTQPVAVTATAPSTGTPTGTVQKTRKKISHRIHEGSAP